MIKNYFSEKEEEKKELIFRKIKEEFIELKNSSFYKSAIEQKIMNKILLELSLIYTLLVNKISLPSKGEIN